MITNLRSIVLLLMFLLSCLQVAKAQSQHVNSLNTEITFIGDRIMYKGQEIELGPNAFYVDGQLSDDLVSKHKYVFNSINDAAKELKNGTEKSPMVLYIAPWVYWIDDPDDPEIRLPKKSGKAPIGLEIECEWLKFHGLSDNPRDVVLASNRGQTMGAKGNFTMFSIRGNGTSSENVTFGNYCNIDLEYPLMPSLNRSKRGSAIVQAQLLFTYGDKLVARNTHFVSRLNLAPFWGGERTLFDQCHFEATDDALTATGVYLNCTFDLYSSKPFYHTIGTGAILLNCTIQSFTRGQQYWLKNNGQLAIIDSKMESNSVNYWGWSATPDIETKYYSSNNNINNESMIIGSLHPSTTVDMTGKKLLDAYRFEHNAETIYNTYNLLRGDDDWDPMELKETVLAAEKANGSPYINLPTQLVLSSTGDTIETGKESIILSAKAFRFGKFEAESPKVNWSVDPEFETLVRLEVLDNSSCRIIPTHEGDNITMVVINASTDYGLEAASRVYVSPEILDAPKFSLLPELVINSEGDVAVTYGLDMPFRDESLVTWYRCSDGNGSNPIEVAVSRFNEPLLNYELTAGDCGWYIMVKVEAKHLRSQLGEPSYAITNRAITPSDIKTDSHLINVNLRNLSTNYQPEVKEGFFTLDTFAPVDTREYDWEFNDNSQSWYYGKGIDGAANDTGLVQASKGARLRYTPVGDHFGDMKILFTAVPAKSAGQGFSSARQQYMDIFIKYDTRTSTGYGLRLIRTTKYSDAIDFILMKYENGVATPISESVSADCYRPNCHIELKIEGNRFAVHAENPIPYHIIPNRPEVVQVVNMEAYISPGNHGGFGFQHTGTVGGGATLIKDLQVEWKPTNRNITRARWTTIAHRMPTEWYASAEAKKVAENLLISQKEYGGWEKNQPYHLHFSDSIKQYYLQSKNEVGGTFDNGSTITEMRFLAKVYANTGDPRYKEAFEKGLNYIFMAQYQNGGWPQFYPARKTEDEIRTDNTIPYSMHITYNDNAMLNTMNLLKDIFMNSNDFASLNLDEETKRKAKRAFDAGIECILNTQILLDDQPTVWCAQHHYQTLKPVAARSYELESFSGAESVGLVLLLMEVDNPSDEIIAAVEGAINWFRKNKVEGIRVERFTDEEGERDARVIEDENAPPLWGRFYDLETVTPFFCSRDGIKRGSMEEIDRERRAGYGWYTDAPSTALKRYPIWREKMHHKTANN